MSFTFTHSAAIDLPALIHRLLTVAHSDTLFWDLYLSKARKLIAPLLPFAEYQTLEKEQSSSVHLPDQIRTAMESGNWQQTQELSGRLNAIRSKLETKRPLIELGQLLYDAPQVPVDPFSPGLQGFAGVTGTGLADLRKRVMDGLATLAKEDRDWRDFYQQRQSALQRLALDGEMGNPAEGSPLASAQLQQEAIDAFKRGNFDRLAEVAGRLQTLDKDPGRQENKTPENRQDQEGTALLANFSAQTLAQGEKLGLNVAQAESRQEKYGPLRRLAWHPAIGREGSLPGEAQRVSNLTLPAEAPEAMKELIRMFMIHPFISSGGSRYLPSLVSEEFLVEDFPDPLPGLPMPTSPLLEALALNRRDQLSRLRIERALLDHGDTVITQLGLSPFEYRLVCIPFDLYLRLGLQKGWGQQPMWTHFDGYMIQRDGHRMALAGGDIRFGGIFDMVGIGVNYESERVFARFAVVQRKRMAAW